WSAMNASDDLLSSLSMVVRLDREHLQPQLDTVSLQPLIERLDAMYTPLAQERDLDWRVTPTLAWVHTDIHLLDRMLSNLIANAFRCTVKGGVMLSCRERHNGLLIQVW